MAIRPEVQLRRAGIVTILALAVFAVMAAAQGRPAGRTPARGAAPDSGAAPAPVRTGPARPPRAMPGAADSAHRPRISVEDLAKLPVDELLVHPIWPPEAGLAPGDDGLRHPTWPPDHGPAMDSRLVHPIWPAPPGGYDSRRLRFRGGRALDSLRAPVAPDSLVRPGGTGPSGKASGPGAAPGSRQRRERR